MFADLPPQHLQQSTSTTSCSNPINLKSHFHHDGLGLNNNPPQSRFSDMERSWGRLLGLVSGHYQCALPMLMDIRLKGSQVEAKDETVNRLQRGCVSLLEHHRCLTPCTSRQTSPSVGGIYIRVVSWPTSFLWLLSLPAMPHSPREVHTNYRQAK